MNGTPEIERALAARSAARRRGVAACIRGVDINPLAGELTELPPPFGSRASPPMSPLNFLDHHLYHGKALLFVMPEGWPASWHVKFRSGRLPVQRR